MKTKFSIGKNQIGIRKKDSPIVIRALRTIEKDTGLLTPSVVIQYAKPKSSPLHRFFTWNDTLAAERYREWQARSIINCVQVTIADESGDELTVRAFVNVSPHEDVDEGDLISERGYISVQKASLNSGYKGQVIQYAYNQLIGWKKRFGTFKEFFAVAKEIERVRI